MPRLVAATTCVDYADYFSLVADSWKPVFDQVAVATHPRDQETPLICRQHGFTCVPTEVFFANGATFNMGGGRQVALEALAPLEADDWVAMLDADIYFPPGYRIVTAGRNPDCLYGACRRMCPTIEHWHRYLKEGRLDELQPFFPLDKPLGLIVGYLQVFRYGTFLNGRLRGRYPQGPSAQAVDTEFAKTFRTHHDPRQRYDLPEVVHLGPNKVNWYGRVTERFA